MSEQQPVADGLSMEERRGYGAGEFDLVERYLPAFHEARRRELAEVYTPADPELPIKYRELIVAGVLASKCYPSVDQHLRRAVREGASMKELVEAIVCARIPGGGPTLHFTLPYLAAIEADLEAGRPI